jgi:hypothetical protein
LRLPKTLLGKARNAKECADRVAKWINLKYHSRSHYHDDGVGFDTHTNECFGFIDIVPPFEVDPDPSLLQYCRFECK